MIIKASQRGGAMQLGVHLLKAENEHVEIHELRGFVADDVLGAMKETQAVAQGTRCKQHLFSVSLSPPPSASVSIDKFEAAIDRVEKANGLTGQPRMVIFHEKEGRRHAHCVWSRIDADTMTARPLPFFKMKLREISKGLFLEHGWQMPRGLMDSKERDPHNFTLAEWHQAKRMGRDPRQVKALIQECWAVSDSRPAFEKALQERGIYLSKGDKRGHVAVTYEGEVLSVARLVGKKAKEVAAKLGNADNLRSVSDTKLYIAQTITPRLDALIQQAVVSRTRELEPLEKRRSDMTERHEIERQRMTDGQQARTIAETRLRHDRFRNGVAGLWDRLTGRHSEITQLNEREAFNSFQRDRAQRDTLVHDQLNERRVLQREIVAVRRQHFTRILNLHRDLSRMRLAAGLRRPVAQRIQGRSAAHIGPGLGR